MGPRFLLVSSALGVCAVVALFALAADQYSQINTADELASGGAVKALQAMLQKQAAMDAQEANLFAQLTTKKKAAVHKEAAAKKTKHSIKTARCARRRLLCAPPFVAPGGACDAVGALGAELRGRGSVNTSKGKSDEVAKLKAELAAAEAKDKKDTASVHKVSLLVET
jgi:hypothetical protein